MKTTRINTLIDAVVPGGDCQKRLPSAITTSQLKSAKGHHRHMCSRCTVEYGCGDKDGIGCAHQYELDHPSHMASLGVKPTLEARTPNYDD